MNRTGKIDNKKFGGGTYVNGDLVTKALNFVHEFDLSVPTPLPHPLSMLFLFKKRIVCKFQQALEMF